MADIRAQSSTCYKPWPVHDPATIRVDRTNPKVERVLHWAAGKILWYLQTHVTCGSQCRKRDPIESAKYPTPQDEGCGYEWNADVVSTVLTLTTDTERIEKILSIPWIQLSPACNKDEVKENKDVLLRTPIDISDLRFYNAYHFCKETCILTWVIMRQQGFVNHKIIVVSSGTFHLFVRTNKTARVDVGFSMANISLAHPFTYLRAETPLDLYDLLNCKIRRTKAEKQADTERQQMIAFSE